MPNNDFYFFLFLRPSHSTFGDVEVFEVRSKFFFGFYYSIYECHCNSPFFYPKRWRSPINTLFNGSTSDVAGFVFTLKFKLSTKKDVNFLKLMVWPDPESNTLSLSLWKRTLFRSANAMNKELSVVRNWIKANLLSK